MVHGFRSTFRDWASETIAYPRDMVEMALSHWVCNAMEQSCAPGDLFQKHARLMAHWATLCGQRTPAGSSVPMRQPEAA